MKKFPSWLIYLAAIGLGFFAFVITAGVLSGFVGPRFGGLFMMLFITLLGLVAAYFSFRYSRRFMVGHIFKTTGQTAVQTADRASDADNAVSANNAVNASGEQKKRLAMALFFSGTVLFPVFIFMLLSSIINIYAQNSY